MTNSWRVVVVTGPVGAGKTTAVAAVGDLLEDVGVRHAVIDMDQLRQIAPRHPDDPYGVRLGLVNLAAVVPNLRAEGAEVLLLADVVEHPDERATYERACPGGQVTVVRLSVPLDVVADRLRDRESPRTLAWHLRRVQELETLMVRRGVGDLVVDAADRAPRDVAVEIVGRCALVTVAGRAGRPSTEHGPTR